ncbi:MAG: lipoyl(octanoyl) transferase LipB [Bacteroidetes bacterium]|nr:lipoyl(octanoyl) transferase LipB [Bacteroidota bacterium]
MLKTIFIDKGLISYRSCWDYQEELFQKVIQAKTNLPENGINPNYLVFCEHPHVYTLGKSGAESNLLINMIQLQAKNAEFVKTNRGGDITYHGPGQLVGYPIISLEEFKMGVKEYVFNLEEVIILTLLNFGITTSRLSGATGVWLGTNTSNPRKICAIGVRVSRFVTMHGFALNINTDLSYFNFINPCGFTDKKVTSLEKELSSQKNIDNVKSVLKENFTKVFGMDFT